MIVMHWSSGQQLKIELHKSQTHDLHCAIATSCCHRQLGACPAHPAAQVIMRPISNDRYRSCKRDIPTLELDEKTSLCLGFLWWSASTEVSAHCLQIEHRILKFLKSIQDWLNQNWYPVWEEEVMAQGHQRWNQGTGCSSLSIPVLGCPVDRTEMVHLEWAPC